MSATVGSLATSLFRVRCRNVKIPVEVGDLAAAIEKGAAARWSRPDATSDRARSAKGILSTGRTAFSVSGEIAPRCLGRRRAPAESAPKESASPSSS